MNLPMTASSLLATMGIGYFEMDLTGVLTHGNRDFFEALGYEPHELLGKHFRRYIPREKVPWMFNVFQVIYLTRMVEKKFPFEFIFRDGSLRYAEGSIALLTDEQGTPVGYRGILTEITDRKKKESTLIEQKKKAERELEIAREIQSSFLVKDYPQPAGWEIATYIRPARQVSGDFYDVFILDTNKIGVVIGDVADKGVPSAIFMARAHALIIAEADSATSPGDVLCMANRHITRLEKSTQFVTALYGVLDTQSGEFSYARAGHEPPLLMHPHGDVHRLPHKPGMALGLWENIALDEYTLFLPKGSLLVMFTDGMTDCRSPRGEPFGLERVKTTLSELQVMSAQSGCDQLFETLKQYQDGSKQDDDVTLVAIHAK